MESLGIKDFTVGNIVVCKHVGNRARHDPDGYTLGKVSKVGRVIVTIALDARWESNIEFRVEKKNSEFLQQNTDNPKNYILFPSNEAFLEYYERERKVSEIKDSLGLNYSQCNLTLDQVRRIHKIISE